MNSNVYIVTYDLGTPCQRYDELIKLIKSAPQWARLGGSSYLIVSYETAEQLRDRYMSVLDSNDKLYVGIVSAPAAWVNMPNDVSQWIKTKLE